MQTQLLLDTTPPPSYEESIYFKQLIDQIKTQRRKTPPPSYNSKHGFEWSEFPNLVDKIKKPPHDDDMENKENQLIHERLERVSTNLIQMIQVAKNSLQATTIDLPDIEDTLSLQTYRINRKRSLERLQSSQISLARTIDQLNNSITQHIITTLDYTHHHQHIHHHHHHHHHHQKRTCSTPKKSTVPIWTNLLGQSALVFGICHHLFFWSKSTSSIAGAIWLISLLCAKKKYIPVIFKSPLLAFFRQQ
ncbi:hypothetical protein BC941DRAFT_481320 [Chlamydoabsidia padenii]|nr:hypothetical protein BC941DRAFT_481320 [Chlamydoabsidia padenii]